MYLNVSMDTRAAVQVGDRAIELWTLPVPDQLGDDEALLAVEGSGMCGSDWRQYLGTLVPCYPVINGHEIVGRIERIGRAAAARMGVDVGDRVAVETAKRCGTCSGCRNGARCEHPMHYGYTSVDDGTGLNGGYAEYLVLRAGTVVYPMPDHLSIEDAVFFNPLGSGLDWVTRLGGTSVGDTVVINGPGQRGLGCILAAREVGAATIIVAGRGRRPWKLELARSLGATHVVNTDEDSLPDAVRSITGGAMADVAVDTTTPAATQALSDCVASLRMEGTLVLTVRKDVEPEGFAGSLISKAVTAKGALAASSWGKRQAVRMLSTRRYDLTGVHTHTFPIDDLDLAIRTFGGEVPGEDAVHITVTPR
jgi:threonine dehydrogenase-like Zn-dependent dehydrogenase